MKQSSIWARGSPSSWATLYFLVPLIGTFEFSLRMRRGEYSFDAYRIVLADPQFQATFTYSTIAALGDDRGRRAARGSHGLLGPASPAQAAPDRGVHHPAAAGHPGDRHRVRLSPALQQLVHPAADRERRGTDLLLTFGYVTLALPYMYRAVDTGLRAIDVRTLTEAAEILGASWPTIIFRVILPNVRVAVLSGAFLTFAIVIGEFTMASLLNRPAFGPYLQLIGANRAYEPAALAIIAFLMTWACMGLINVVRQRRRQGARHERALRGNHGWHFSRSTTSQRASASRHVVQNFDLADRARASSSPSSAPAAAARPRPCAWSPASRAQLRAPSASTARDVTGLRPNKRNIGMVFQSYALFPNMTVAENVGFGLKIAKRPAARDRRPRRGDAEADQAADAGRPLSLSAFRRPAAARGAGQGARRQAASAPAGRAALGARCENPRLAARGNPRAPARARHHHHLRDARPGRGAVDVRPHRGDERRTRRADRHALRNLQLPAHAVRRLVRRHAEHPARPGDRRGGRTRSRSTTRRFSPRGASRMPKRATFARWRCVPRR